MAQKTLPVSNTLTIVGPLIFIIGVLALGYGAWRYFSIHNLPVAYALIGGSVAAVATGIGTLPLLVTRTLSVRAQDTMLGFAAGIMLAACSFSLIIPGIDAAIEQSAGPWGAGMIIGVAIFLGSLLISLIERYVPHEHFIKGVEGHQAQILKRIWLFVFAIILHNVPEGLAIGVAFGGTDYLRASALAAGIAIQNMPEGFVVAVALFTAGYKRSTAVLLGVASGLVEPVAAVLGALVINLSSMLLPWGLGFAAGAMLYVISHEMIPESHRKGHESYATWGLIIGFIIMMLLDTALG